MGKCMFGRQSLSLLLLFLTHAFVGMPIEKFNRFGQGGDCPGAQFWHQLIQARTMQFLQLAKLHPCCGLSVFHHVVKKLKFLNSLDENQEVVWNWQTGLILKDLVKELSMVWWNTLPNRSWGIPGDIKENSLKKAAWW